MASNKAWTGPDPSQITAWTIVQAGHSIGRRFRAVFADLGFSHPVQFGILLQLDQEPDMSNGELARAVLVTPQTMSQLLAALERQGLVSRTPSAGRGHRITARLTPAGRRQLRRCVDAIAHVEASLGLRPHDARQLNGLLHRVISTDANPSDRALPGQTDGVS